MPQWRTRWHEREARLQLRLLAGDIEILRFLIPTLERLALMASAEDLITNAATVSDDLEARAREMRDQIDTELTRSILDEME